MGSWLLLAKVSVAARNWLERLRRSSDITTTVVVVVVLDAFEGSLFSRTVQVRCLAGDCFMAGVLHSINKPLSHCLYRKTNLT